MLDKMTMGPANGDILTEGPSGQTLSVSAPKDKSKNEAVRLSSMVCIMAPLMAQSPRLLMKPRMEFIRQTSNDPPYNTTIERTYSVPSGLHKVSVKGLSNGTAQIHSADITPFNRDVAAAAQSGQYFFPAEQGPHRATILAYPSCNSLPADLIGPVRAEISELANAIACFEPVRIFVRPEDMNKARVQMLRQIDR